MALLADSRENHTSETKAVETVARNLGIVAETLRRWNERADREKSANPGEFAELKRLRRENAELHGTNEILQAASAFFAGHGSTWRIMSRKSGTP
ncbi:transposase [Bifidobacterium aquikefiri]|uniref:transposase n=1 Tax=Bifidobacterium aquikefiri TaxID=1653207 RepID=UPI0039EC6DE1